MHALFSLKAVISLTFPVTQTEILSPRHLTFVRCRLMRASLASLALSFWFSDAWDCVILLLQKGPNLCHSGRWFASVVSVSREEDETRLHVNL